MARTIFAVNGPFDVPLQPNTRAKMVAEDLSLFWAECSSLRSKIGVYVFAIRAGKGLTPLYVGKTTKSFERECFTDHKLKHYNYALADYQKGTPVMFFVTYPAKKGPVSTADIADLEDFLIQVGRTINADLRNIRGVAGPSWGIKGIIRGGKGNTNDSEKQFRRLFGMDSE